MKRIALLLIFCLSVFAADPTTALYYDASGNLQYICTATPAKAEAGSWSVSGSTLTSVVDSSNTATVTTASAHGLLIGDQVTFSGTTFTIAATTLTNVVVSSNVGTVTTKEVHGLLANDYVTFSGATVDTDLNGEYQIQTVPTTKTFTITTSSVADATYVDATLQFVTCDDELLSTFTIATVPTTATFTFVSANLTDATYNEVGLSMATTYDVVLVTSAYWGVQKLVYDASDQLIRVLWADGNQTMDNVCGDRESLTYR